MSAEPSNKQPMTTEDLLKPRYKVIADYLFSPYKIGNVIVCENHQYKQVHLATINVREMGENIKQECFYDIEDCKLYPALFKPLAWYEDREVGDMPEYVKYDDGGVYKIDKWELNIVNELMPKRIDGIINANVIWHFKKKKSLPATLTEFDHYINSKSKK